MLCLLLGHPSRKLEQCSVEYYSNIIILLTLSRYFSDGMMYISVNDVSVNFRHFVGNLDLGSVLTQVTNATKQINIMVQEWPLIYLVYISLAKTFLKSEKRCSPNVALILFMMT